MPRRMFDFVCKNSHNTEAFVEVDTKEVQCGECGETATRIISPSRVYIDPISGDSQVATARWARMRSEKIALEKKEKANHGS
jgi:hypothetical protein